MASLNAVQILGNLGKDPEVKTTPGGQMVCNFSVATTRSWTDKKSNEKHEATEWHRVVVWGKLAELCGQYLRKGRQCHVSGRLETRSWEKDGQKHYTTEINAQDVLFLGSKGEDAAQSQPESKPRGYGKKQSEPPETDEIPF